MTATAPTQLDQELDKERFFQTDDSIKKQNVRQKKSDEINKQYGDPWFKCSSQVLALTPAFSGVSESGSSFADHIYVGESGFLMKKVDLSSGAVKQSFRGHEGPVTCVVHVNVPQLGGEYLFSGSWDKAVRQWDPKTGSQLRLIDGHADFVKSLHVQVYPRSVVSSLLRPTDCQESKFVVLLFSGSSDRSVKVWLVSNSADTQKTSLCKLEGHRRGIESITSHPNTANPTLYTCSSDGSVREWNFVTGECLRVFEGHLTNVNQIHFADDPEDVELYSSSADGFIKKWDLQKGKCLVSLKHKENVRCFVQIGRYIISGSRDERIRVWDLMESPAKIVAYVDAYLDEVSAMAVVDGQVIAGSYDGSVRRWDIKTLVADGYKRTILQSDASDVAVSKPPAFGQKQTDKEAVGLTAEEEAELAELMDD